MSKVACNLALILCIAEVFTNGYFVASATEESELAKSRGYYDLWNSQAVGALNLIRQNGNSNGFYRVCFQNAPTDNISMLYGYHGLGYFASIENVTLREVMGRYGYATSPRFLLDYGSTPVMRMLLGQRYHVQLADPRGNNPQYYSVNEIPETLGLGYMVSDEIKDFTIGDETNPFENQERLVSAMCGRNMNIYKTIEESLRIEQQGIKVELANEGIQLTRESEAPAFAYYKIRGEEGGPAYAYFSFWGESIQDRKSPLVISALDSRTTFSPSYLTMPHIIPLHMDENGDYQVNIIMTEDGMDSLSYENQYFVLYNEEAGKEVFSCLNKHPFEIQFFFGFTDCRKC